MKLFHSFTLLPLSKVLLLILPALFVYPSNIHSETDALNDLTSCLVTEKKSGKTVLSLEPDRIVPAASTIKLVTALTAVERVKPHDIITITKTASMVKGTGAGLRAGERYRFSQLLQALLVKSANDAAVAIAVHVAGSEKKYLSIMNSWCAAHGFTKTRAADAAGLNPGTVSSAGDLAGIFRLFEKNTLLMAILKLSTAEIQSEKGRKIHLKTTNLLNRFFRESGVAVPGKTGFTAKAGFCFTGIYISSDIDYYVTYMGAQDSWRQLYALISHAERRRK